MAASSQTIKFLLSEINSLDHKLIEFRDHLKSHGFAIIRLSNVEEQIIQQSFQLMKTWFHNTEVSKQIFSPYDAEKEIGYLNDLKLGKEFFAVRMICIVYVMINIVLGSKECTRRFDYLANEPQFFW